MRWFDSDFDYVHEFMEHWNSQRRKVRTASCIAGILLIIAGILTIVFPVGIFAVIQYVAAAALIILGIYRLVSYASVTWHFKDPMLIVTGILNILLGILLLFMPVVLTVQVITFLFAFLLIFSGTQKISFASRMKYFRIGHTGALTFSGVLDIILAVIFLFLPFTSALTLNYIISAYLILGGITLLIEAAGMHKLE
ncbi:hypothetical protein B5F07_09990 [Lachnoclostridium sp. An169]|uniref:HdeD family acid-resistance protein n=1 Tax=Lachnoclostridium sp. An169 TaxID=1965569 RepID=UPI000B3AFDA2|nr:DUF308 domain-containing protein [Lachnoclostridium sp. An169]OUP83594.1 hypothetical protein B5F07_09990 [Lachnoclostridium sp. An169]